jgi:hypothetical protein
VSSAIELLEADLAEVRERLAGYTELKEQEQRLSPRYLITEGVGGVM